MRRPYWHAGSLLLVSACVGTSFAGLARPDSYPQAASVTLPEMRGVEAREEFRMPPPPVHDPIAAVTGLISRVLGTQYLGVFEFEVISADPATKNDVFEIDYDSASNAIVLRGNTGVSLASALHAYLRTYMNVSIAWGRDGSGNQLSTLNGPWTLVRPNNKTRTVSPYKLRYMYNVCTAGYTTAWWDANQWQEEIDRLAMWGINLPLAFGGQEYIWVQFFTQLGLNVTDVTGDWMAGPAFLPWYRMGNIQRWGGPLALTWIQQQRDLQHVILGAMRAYGMMPVLPGFAGHVPEAFTRVYPYANVTRNTAWGAFNATYSDDYLLQPSDPLFVHVGQRFYEALIAEYGTSHFYNMDTFNGACIGGTISFLQRADTVAGHLCAEMRPASNDSTYLKLANEAIYRAMTAVDPQGIYVMQGWLFFNDQQFWGPPQVQAYLSGVPNTSMLILDLYTESSPVWQNVDSYYGKPWIWNMLQIFGGRRALYGNLSRIATGPIEDFNTPGSSMLGLGATPEATEMVPIMFDLLFEMGWRTQSPDVSAWVQNYAVRRYGRYSPSISQAMALLQDAVYSSTANYSTTQKFCWIEQWPTYYNPSPPISDVTATVQALRLFVEAARSGEVNASLSTFSYDLVDLTRQVLCNLFADVVNVGGSEYNLFVNNGLNMSASVVPAQNTIMQIIQDLDTILHTNENFLLGNWLQDAKRWATTPQEAATIEYNARNQITLWGPDGEINDYAAKNGWQGLVGDYYMGRWAIHTGFVIQSATTNTPIPWTTYGAEMQAFQTNWTFGTKVYSTSPVGSTVKVAEMILKRYASGNRDRYGVLRGQDALPVGTGSVDIYPAWHKDVDVLMFLCDLDPRCLGFNSLGLLKNSTSNIVSGQPCDLYLKLF